MRLSRKRLGRAFFVRPAPVVARDLLGRVLVRTSEDGSRIAGSIVETEAYTQDDAASHSYRGRTERNAMMFERAGSLYVYFTYGMHFCLNVVTGEIEEGSAVLLRALQPLEGLETMGRNRGISDVRLLCSGPARLCQAFGVAASDNGVDLTRGGSFRVEAGASYADAETIVTPRVGIRHAADLQRRYVVRSSGWASRRHVAG